jgi:hypothetical protein
MTEELIKDSIMVFLINVLLLELIVLHLTPERKKMIYKYRHSFILLFIYFNMFLIRNYVLI